MFQRQEDDLKAFCILGHFNFEIIHTGKMLWLCKTSLRKARDKSAGWQIWEPPKRREPKAEPQDVASQIGVSGPGAQALRLPAGKRQSQA